MARGERDGVEVQSKPTAESLALFADISWDFDHTVEIAGAQSCFAFPSVKAAHVEYCGYLFQFPKPFGFSVKYTECR